MILTDKQKEFWNNANARWNIKTGATRSGKTWLDYYIIPRRIRERIGKEGIVLLLGNTQSTLWRNVIEPMQKIYGSKLVSNIKANNQVELFGETCYALGADKLSQVKKIQGASIKYCYGDEVATWSKEVFEMLKSRMDKPYSCFDGTLNPENKRHWFKKDFLDVIKEKGIDAFVQHYTIDDNPTLDPKFVQELKKEYLGTVYYPRFILGLWTNAEGLLFQQLANDPGKFEYIKHEEELKDGKPINFPMVTIGMDIGGTKSHTPLVATGFKHNWSKIVTFDEEIIKHAKGTIDTDIICARTLQFVLKLQKQGYNVMALYIDNASQVIINTVRKYLNANKVKIAVQDCYKTDGATRILVYNLLLNTGRMQFINAPMTVEALSTAMYDEKAQEDKILDDFSSDVDTFDAHYYSFSTFLNYLGMKIRKE